MGYIRDDKLIKKLGARIRKLRKKRALTMMDVSNKSGVDYVQISRIERGIINPGISHIGLLAKVLKIELKDLFDWDKRI